MSKCECGDKIGFHALERQLAEAQKLLGRVPDAVRGEGKDLHFHPSKLKRLLADIDRILSTEGE